MIILNAQFTRKVLGKGSLRFQQATVTGIELDRKWDDPADPDGVKLRAALLEHTPPGEGWHVQGYCLVAVKGEDS